MTLTQLKVEEVEVGGITMKTRHWYMDCAKDLTSMQRHRIYWSQFCTVGVIRDVKAAFSKDQWAKMAKAFAEGDEHLNACTELRQWDRIDVRYIVGRMKTETVYADAPKGTIYWAPSDNTCITKEAARQLLESGEYPR